MEKIYRLMLEEILPGVATGNAGMQALIRQFGEGLQLNGGHLTFTLPALFSCTVAHHNQAADDKNQFTDNRENYIRFRELLFQYSPNVTLAPFGLQVGIELADLDPDLIVYTLQRLGDAP
ncbi:MAG TPA: hypothetical protein ENI94_04355 [Gammaproteobacteria bacterium]|nr:hypothetical protein [Gammaproteobacteria bacterium]